VRFGLVLAGVLAGLVLPGAAPATGSPAQRAVVIVKASLSGRHEVRWAALHPKDQALTTKARFVACERRNADALRQVTVRSVQAEGTSVYHVSVPELGTVDVNDVTLAIAFRKDARTKTRIAEVDSLWVSYKGRWVQIYTPDEVTAYKAGKCP
jgi:hypothetical protein